MAYSIHPRLTTRDNMGRYVWFSIGLHVVALLLMTFTLGHTARLAPPASIKVQLVGIPQPTMASKPKELEPIRTQDSPAPKEPPLDAKSMPETDATTKLAQQVTPTQVLKKSDVAAAERPPVLDKTPQEKKVVKNDLKAKVVKNPEDFLAQLDFIDDMAKQAAKPTPNTKASTKPSGEGPQLQVDMGSSGVAKGISDAVNKNWLIPPGADVRGLSVVVNIRLNNLGELTSMQVIESSGQTYLDNALLRAIQKSIPLPIPANELETYSDMNMRFAAPL